MTRWLLLCALGAFVVSLQIHETEAQRSRVCFAQSGDYSTNTAMGFCSQAIYMALTPTSRGLLGLVNSANDADDIMGGIKKFTSRKTTYSYLELYLGMVGSVAAGNIAWLNNPTTRASFIQLVIEKLKVYPEMTGLYVDFEGMTSTFTANYAAFLTTLKTELDKINVKLATALPYDALTYAGVYYNTVLPTLPFNVLKTYEDMYATSTTVTHPIALLYSLAAPFNVDSKTISNNVFRWVIAGLPTSNIILGLPMYSLKFTASGATNFNAAATAVVKDTYCIAFRFNKHCGR
ncbi:AGAP000789-PA-like protein [Anopheles sinensis]|uniref:AGAP000789-PA-like protein n=1 Tax=Anopheles sinensis TaxID=74873 RepID=A0A084VIU8_ANOSI|nr:AGAP000789-PA-like protein [Anopheles sinensis]